MRAIALGLLAAALAACQSAPPVEPAELLLVNARGYSLDWDDPAGDGAPAANAPRGPEGWQPDLEAVAVRAGRIVFAGTRAEAEGWRGPETREIDLGGATLVPGLVDAHTHVVGLGERVSGVDLTGVETEADAVARVKAYAAGVPKGTWIIGRGWDEGAWANRYPDMGLLTQEVPDHPVVLDSLHGFAVWGNKLAFDRAGITRDTQPPVGGEIRRDARGNPTGILLNRATPLLRDAVPEPTPDEYERFVLAGLREMARGGFTTVHEAGVDRRLLAALESLAQKGQLPVRVYAMLSARDADLCREWLAKGPTPDGDGMLAVRAVKAYYDGALGSRGARLLEPYADMPDHTGVSGEGYGFDRALVAEMIAAGFQVGIHAIGDAGNRETLDFLAGVLKEHPHASSGRHRIEHAQVLHPDDIPRLAAMNLTASMQPPHAVEDKTWAEQRLGPDRVTGAYAWRTLRQAGATVVFSSDLPGSDHDIFYGLHAAVTRRDKDREPAEGWYPAERVTPEEALLAYTSWPAWSAFRDDETGTIREGAWADLTALSIDPLRLGETDPGAILDGQVRLTIVGGRIVYEVSK